MRCCGLLCEEQAAIVATSFAKEFVILGGCWRRRGYLIFPFHIHLTVGAYCAGEVFVNVDFYLDTYLFKLS